MRRSLRRAFRLLMILFIAFDSISLGQVVLLLVVERFSTKVRGRAMSLSLVSL
jgi:hypothetical protein